ncbi:hypothetical protein I3843_Q041900 [Carya illinoinensis]|nr:hypothetical protein I3843_Q041900 [Carya illinoinensis]
MARKFYSQPPARQQPPRKQLGSTVQFAQSLCFHPAATMFQMEPRCCATMMRKSPSSGHTAAAWLFSLGSTLKRRNHHYPAHLTCSSSSSSSRFGWVLVRGVLTVLFVSCESIYILYYII